MNDGCLLETRPLPGAVLLTLNRPGQHNALNSELIAALKAAFLRLRNDAECRVLVLAGAGKSFCAGADLKSMRAKADDTRALAEMLLALHELPQPRIALVHRAAIAGGLGLVAVCDIAIASSSARFSFPEVRLGLVPAVISPYVVAAIGLRATRALFLTGENFDAATALRVGLVHRVYPDHEVQQAGLDLVNQLLRHGPAALAAVRPLLAHAATQAIDEQLTGWTADFLAQLRGGAEAQEGMLAVLEHRDPRWSG
jgi:methylglutaconyl-CoA hydratase